MYRKPSRILFYLEMLLLAGSFRLDVIQHRVLAEIVPRATTELVRVFGHHQVGRRYARFAWTFEVGQSLGRVDPRRWPRVVRYLGESQCVVAIAGVVLQWVSVVAAPR